MPRLTLADVQPLLAQFAGEGMLLSLYADLGVPDGFRDGFRRNWEPTFQAKVDALWKFIGADGRLRQEVEENVAALREAVAGQEAAAARWVAAFSSTRRGFRLAIPVDVPVETEVVLDRSPYLVPLLAAIHRRREYLALHTDTHRARILGATPAGVRLLAELDADVPKHQRSSGERYGYGQATIARHREDAILHFRKDLVIEVARLWDADQYSGLFLLGEHEVLEHVRKALPPRLAERVLRERPGSFDPSELQEAAALRSMAAEVFAAQEAGVVPGFWDLLKTGSRLAKGADAVIHAIQSGQFGESGHGYLVFGPDPREAVGRCIACRTLSQDPVGRCPRCEAPCAPGSLWEELLLTALQHRIAAYFIPDPRKLAGAGGVVAVLPRNKPTP